MNPPDAIADQLLVSPETPWLGLAPFTERQGRYFFGRKQEVDNLFERVAQKPLTVLFGTSGLGKTSLLEAGLIPRLKRAGFLPVRLRLDHHRKAPRLEAQIMATLHAVLREALPSGISSSQPPQPPQPP